MTSRHREADGALATKADHALNLARPVTLKDWAGWHRRWDGARLALHHVAMNMFHVKPSMWPSRGVPTCITEDMSLAEEWLREMTRYYGLTYADEAYFEDQWCAPAKVRRHPPAPPKEPKLNAGKPAVASVKTPHPGGKRPYKKRAPHSDGVVDSLLVSQVIKGSASPTRLSPEERVLVAGHMAAANRTTGAIAHRLRCKANVVGSLLAEYNARYEHGNEGISA